MTALLDPGGAPVTYRMDNKLAGSLVAGSTVTINERWFADVAVVKTFLKTKAKFSTGQTQDIKLDPLAVSVSIGYNYPVKQKIRLGGFFVPAQAGGILNFPLWKIKGACAANAHCSTSPTKMTWSPSG
jgi:hypothetical protein